MLTIPVLEFLAVSFNLIIFSPVIPPSADAVCLHVDAEATPLAMALHNPHSPAMQQVYLQLQALPEFVKLKPKLLTTQIFGPANLLADAASRGKLAVLEGFCKQMGIKPVCMQVDPRAVRAARDLVDIISKLDDNLPSVPRPPGPVVQGRDVTQESFGSYVHLVARVRLLSVLEQGASPEPSKLHQR